MNFLILHRLDMVVFVRKADHSEHFIEGVDNLGVGGTMTELHIDIREMRCLNQDGTRTMLGTKVRGCGGGVRGHWESRRGERPDILREPRQRKRWQRQTGPQRRLAALLGGRGI